MTEGKRVSLTILGHEVFHAFCGRAPAIIPLAALPVGVFTEDAGGTGVDDAPVALFGDENAERKLGLVVDFEVERCVADHDVLNEIAREDCKWRQNCVVHLTVVSCTIRV